MELSVYQFCQTKWTLKTRRPCWPCLCRPPLSCPPPPSCPPPLSRSSPPTTSALCTCAPGHPPFPTPLPPPHSSHSAPEPQAEYEKSDQPHRHRPPPHLCHLSQELLASPPPPASLTTAGPTLSQSVSQTFSNPSLTSQSPESPSLSYQLCYYLPFWGWG